MRLWVIRAGENLRYFAEFLEGSLVGISFGWGRSGVDALQSDRPALTAAAELLVPDRSPASIATLVSQTWSFIHDLRPDDLVLVPTDRGHAFSLARILDDSRVAPDGSSLALVRSVVWVGHDLKSDSFKQDIKNSLGAIQTVFAPRAPGALERVLAVADGHADPGPNEYVPDDHVAGWVFQCDPRRYDLTGAIGRGPEDTWAMNQHRDRAEVGARIWFRTTAPHQEIAAVARIASLPRRLDEPNDYGAWSVDITYESLLDPPLTQAEVRADQVLGSERALSGAIGTNFPLSDATDLYLADLLADRLRPVPWRQSASRQTEERIYRDVADHREAVEREILEAIAEISADDFELLSRHIVEHIGFEDVQQTGARWTHSLGDGGVDLDARLSQRGLPSLRVRIQSKRQRANVGPAAIQQLRGALRAGEQGVFLTTSRFTRRAIDEAEADGKPPIGRLDGPAIAQLMVEAAIAVRSTSMTLPRFDPKALRSLLSEPADANDST